MLKRKMLLLMVVWMGLMVAACGQVTEQEEHDGGLYGTGFQDNESDKAHADFVLTEIFSGWGGLEEMWDSIDAPGFNRRFTATVDDYTDPFIVFSELGSTIIGDPDRTLIDLVTNDASNLLDLLIDPEENYPLRGLADSDEHVFSGDGTVYMNGFYAFLDQVFVDGEAPGSRELVSINRKIFSRLIDKKSPQELNDDMDELIEDILDDDFKKDFIDMTTALGKLLVRADSAETDADGHRLGVGNATQGLVDVFTWVNRMEQNTVTRALFRSQVSEMLSLFDPSPDSDYHQRIRKLLTTMEDYFTAQGEAYSDPAPDNLYHMDNDEVYCDAEMGGTLRELFPGVLQLLMRSDRPHAMIANAEGEPPVYLLRKMVDHLKALGYDPESANIEQSFLNLMRYDMLGRDRTDPLSGAYPASHLESLLFLTHVTANLGWQDRDIPCIDPTQPEVAGNIPVVADSEVGDPDDARYLHGHGTHTGRLSLNDSLFSIKTHKTMNALGLFDIGLKATDGYDLYRSRQSFTLDERDRYRFFFDQNYDVLQCLAPPCLGDLGSPDGGNPDGQVFDEGDINVFRAYSPDGLNENQLAAWTLGLIVRACVNGEGPYYYADPAAPHFIEGSTRWTVYLRPDGKVYAYVNTNDPENREYFYPVDEGDPEEPDGQTVAGRKPRYTRYKSEWQTDCYMAHYTEEHDVNGELEQVDRFKTVDNSSGQLELVDVDAQNGFAANRLTYRELIAENDPARACSSPEEALFRNYQWFMTEKKLVIIIPLKVDLEGTEAVVWQVLEANGLVGISNLRKFRSNHYWAKAQTNGESLIPGDYRIEVASSSVEVSNVLSASKIYNRTLDCGHATPAVVGMNIPALSRLAFPRYTKPTERAPGIVDAVLGSREFDVSDGTWNERCALMPPFVALITALKEHTPDHGQSDNPLKKGIHSFVQGTSALLKPLVYYQKESGVRPHATWKPRVAGSLVPGPSLAWNDYQGDDFLRSSADFHDNETLRASCWEGTDQEMRHYQPLARKNLLNVLIDSDITAEPDAEDGFTGLRMDGLLPLVMQNRSTTATVNVLLSSVNDRDLLYSGLEQLVSAMKITKGPMTAMNETNVKNIDFPAWIFVKGEGAGAYGELTDFSEIRDESLVLDRAIDRLIGHDRIDEIHDGYGIARYVDEQEEEGWEDLDKALGWLDDLLHTDSPYSVVSDVLDMNEAIFGRDRLYTESEIRGLVYALGKLMTHYDVGEDRWINQGQDGFDDLLSMLRVRLPEIHRLVKDEHGYSGDRYRAILELNRDMLREDGPVEFLATTMETRADWEHLMADCSAFLKDEWVTKDEPMWSSFVGLLSDLARAVEASKDGSLIETIYEDYGFQKN